MHPTPSPASAPLLLLLAILVGGCATTSLPPDDDTDPWQPRASSSAQPAMGANLFGKTILVDAGHGGKDPGAHAITGTWEKSINLAMSQLLAQRLAGHGARAVLSRDTDIFIELDERAAMAQRYDCDLFISVHADSFTSADAKGATVYIARNASATSRRAGEAIHSALRDAGIPTRGVRSAGFRVLVGHSHPAVLVECGYLTNPEEAALLGSDAYRIKLADAIAEGVLAAGI